jgi:hypothetical protein
MSEPQPLYTPPQRTSPPTISSSISSTDTDTYDASLLPAEPQTHRFRRYVNERHAITPPLQTYEELWKWSTGQPHHHQQGYNNDNGGGGGEESLALFWEDVWDFTGVIGTRDNNTRVSSLLYNFGFN